MVSIEWREKKDITPFIEELKLKYKDQFHKVNLNIKTPTNAHQNIEQDDIWSNKLFWGENFKVVCHLLNEFEDKIDLIYIDPPFFSGTDYQIQVKTENSTYEAMAYKDTWKGNLNLYLQMLYERLMIMKMLLSKNGLLFVHLDWHASHYVKMILDEIFGMNRFINNIIWYYYNKYSAGKMNLPRAHDDILVYSKSSNYTFNELRIPRKKPIKQLKRVNVNGILKNVKDENGKVIYRTVEDKKIDDVWDIPCLQPASKEWTGFPNQKHHELIKRIIELGSNEGDIIADFFCGSGTTLISAEKLKRKWIGCDISEYPLYLTINRIKNINKKMGEKSSMFEFLTDSTREKSIILKSGFFDKQIKISRKK